MQAGVRHCFLLHVTNAAFLKNNAAVYKLIHIVRSSLIENNQITLLSLTMTYPRRQQYY